MLWRMVLGALIRGRRRRALIAVTVALGTCVAAAMLSIVLDVGDKVNTELKAYGANINVQGVGAAVLDGLYDLGDTPSRLREDEIEGLMSIFWAHNIVDIAPFLSVTAAVSPQGSDPAESTVTVVGTWFAHPLMGPGGQHRQFGLLSLRSWWTVEGGWIADGDEDLAMVGSVLAIKRGVGIGDELALTTPTSRRTVKVAGIFTSGDGDDEAVVVPLATAQALADAQGEVARVEVSALTTPDNDLARKAARNPASLTTREMETWYCTAYVSAIAYQIEEVMTDAVAKPVRQVAESEGAVLGKTRLLMLLVTALSLVAAALGIANLVTASVIDRAPEIGLLKAIGARDSGVVALVLVEMALVAMVGAVVGYAVGVGCAEVVGRVVFGSGVAVRPMAAGLTAVLVSVVVLAGCLPAVRSLIRVRPADVLQGR